MSNSTFSTLDEYFAGFPNDQPLPLALIAQIVIFRAAQNAAKRPPGKPSGKEPERLKKG